MEKTQNQELFERMPVPAAAAKLMLPTVIGSLVMVIYSLADTYFVGLLNNPVQNAAVTLAAPMLLAFNAVNNLFGIGSSSMMSRALGRKDHDTVRKSASFGFYGSLICGGLISLLCLAFFTPLVKLLGADVTTSHATMAYMKWTVLFGAMPTILNVVLGYLVRAEGSAFHASIGTMSGCLLNIVLDPIFILPWGLGMGAAGAGLATFLSNCVACCYFLVLLLAKPARTLIRLHPRYFSAKKEIVLGICGVGVPASIQNLLNVFGMTILNNFTAAYSTVAVAAIGIAQKIYMVPVQIALGGTQGIMPLIGYSYSSKNHERFKAAIGFVAKLMLPCMVVIAFGCLLLAEPLIMIFIKDAEIIRYGAMFLKAFSLAMPFLVLDFLVVSVFQSIGMGRNSLVFALLRKLALEIPAIIVLNAVFHVTGIAYGAFIAELVLSCIGIWMLFHIIRNLSCKVEPQSAVR